MRGRKPIPTAMKKINGNPGKRPLNDSEPTPPKGEPDMPEHLNETGREAWLWLSEMLGVMGLLAESDRAIMSLYCDTWSEYVDAREKVNTYGMVLLSKGGVPYMSPYMMAESMLKKQLTQYLGELGLSPSSRSRLHVTKMKNEEAGKSRFFSERLKIVG